MSNRTWLRAGLVGVVVILLALIVLRLTTQDADDVAEDSTVTPQTESSTTTTAEGEAEETVVPETETATGTETTTSTGEEAIADEQLASDEETIASDEPATESDVSAAELESVRPSFDILERTPFGSWIMAGRSVPEAEVEIIIDGETLDMVDASPNGDWAVVNSAPVESGNHTFTLRATSPNGEVLTSVDPIVLLIPEGFGLDALTLRVGEDEIETLGTSGEPVDLAIESVSYGEQGRVVVAGRGTVGAQLMGMSRPEDAIDPESAFLRAFHTTVGDDGKWRGRVRYLPVNVPYVIRVVATLPDGREVHEEIRFIRAIPNLKFDNGSVVVQPGNSLWRIARRVYGRGIRYHVIYQANESQINDPDLIYPGQIFQLPEQEGS